MEIGTTTISTAEYMELRAMKDSLEARKAEIEANADKVILNDILYGDSYIMPKMMSKYVGKDEAMKALSESAQKEHAEVERMHKQLDLQHNMFMRHINPEDIDRSPRGRLHFLFTGELFKTKW